MKFKKISVSHCVLVEPCGGKAVRYRSQRASFFRMALMVVLGILVKSASGADTTAITVNPSVLLYPFAYGLQYGKLTLEMKKNPTSSYVVQISGTHLRKHSIESRYSMFDGDDSVEADFNRTQISGFVGKRYFYRFIYVQPTLLFGYSRYRNYLAPNKSFDGVFSSVLIYSGLRLSNDCVFDFNVGAGYDLFGRQAWEFFAPFNVDANFSMGYEF